MMNNNNNCNCNLDYHINIVYCGGACDTYYREYNQTLKFFMSDYSENHMIVSSSDWEGYNDTIKFRESKWYCMLSNGAFISVGKPINIAEEYGDECVIVKITNGFKP